MEKNKKDETEEEKKEEAEEAIKRSTMILKDPIFYLTVIGFFCYCALESSTGLWVGSFFNKNMGSTTDEAAMLTSTFYIGLPTVIPI